MIDELIQGVAAKTGLSEDQARGVVDAVLGLLKDKLPAPFASGLESLVGAGTNTGEDSNSGGTGTDLASEASAMLGSLLGNKS